MKKIYLGSLAVLAQTAVVQAQNGNNGQGNDQDNGGIGWFLAVILFIVLVIWLVRRSNRRNSDVYYNQGPPIYNDGRGYNGPVIVENRPGIGDFVAGAIAGAAAAEIIEDIADSSNYNQPQGGVDDSAYNADTSSYDQNDNTDDNDNSWDSGNDSSFSDDSFNDDSNF